MSKFTPPKWAKFAVATDRGWEDSRTGELLVSMRNLKTDMEAASGSAPAEPTPVEEPVVEEKPKKKARQQKNHFAAKPETPEFESMTKEELELWAREHINVELDRRQTKKSLIEEIQENLK